MYKFTLTIHLEKQQISKIGVELFTVLRKVDYLYKDKISMIETNMKNKYSLKRLIIISITSFFGGLLVADLVEDKGFPEKDPRLIGSWVCVPTSEALLGSGAASATYTPDGRYISHTVALINNGDNKISVELLISGDWGSDGETLKENPNSFKVMAVDYNGKLANNIQAQAFERKIRSLFFKEIETPIFWESGNAEYKLEDKEITIHCSRTGSM